LFVQRFAIPTPSSAHAYNRTRLEAGLVIIHKILKGVPGIESGQNIYYSCNSSF
jgi:hypothetical protein